MKKLIYLFIVASFLPLLVMTSCREKTNPEEETELEVLTEFVTTNSLDLSDILNGWVKPGSALGVVEAPVDYSVPGYYIMDFRSATDFDAGHIRDAHNVAFTNLITAAPADKATKILCVCYTGQTAARATGLLRMAGYANAVCLKWGMSSWNQDFAAKWDNNVGDTTSPNWTMSGTPEVVNEFALPTLSTGKTTGDAILTDRIATVIGLDWNVTNTAVLGNPENYFINNKWGQAVWDEYGHITGAYRMDTADGLGTVGLKNLDTSKPMVTYCYTGQTSAITTAWLQVMGYDNARSLLFGANGVSHSTLQVGTVGNAHKKSWKGASSGSELNYGYYNTAGDYFPPN